MEENAPVLKKFKVTVDKQITQRRHYVIEAVSDDDPAFHEQMERCIDGSAEAIRVEEGSQSGQIMYDELSPELHPVDEYTEPEEILEEEEEEEGEDESFIKVLDPQEGISLHICPFTNIPFLSFFDERPPILPFDYALSGDEANELQASGEWQAGDEVVLMSWTESYVNLDRLKVDLLTQNYWHEIVGAVQHIPHIYEKLNR